MTDIVLTSEHDLFIENGDISLFTTLDTLTAQKVKIRLLNYRGEWFRDINTGVPYLQSILGRKNTKVATDIILQNEILLTENIASITSYSSTINTERKLEVIFSAQMVSGGIIENITIEVA